MSFVSQGLISTGRYFHLSKRLVSHKDVRAAWANQPDNPQEPMDGSSGD
jgi:hypothetical protein